MRRFRLIIISRTVGELKLGRLAKSWSIHTSQDDSMGSSRVGYGCQMNCTWFRAVRRQTQMRAYYTVLALYWVCKLGE